MHTHIYTLNKTSNNPYLYLYTCTYIYIFFIHIDRSQDAMWLTIEEQFPDLEHALFQKQLSMLHKMYTL